MRKDCKLKDICICIASNISLKDIKNTTGDFPLYGASGFVQTIDSYHMETPYIGIVKDGSGVGRVNIYPAYSSLLGTMQYIIPKDNSIVNYLYFLLCSLNLSDFARGAAIPHIYFTDYGNIEIKLHSLEKQYQIVEELDTLTSIIEKQKKQLEELDNLAQAIFYDMFGDPIENEKGWKMNKVSNLSIKMSTGPFGSMLHKSDYTVNGIPSINPQNINNRKIITNDISKVSYQKAEELSKYIVRANDIIIARRGDLSKCAIVTDKEDGWLCGTGSFMLEIKDILPILFYYQYTSQSIQKYLKDKCIGATMPNLNQKIIGGIKVIVPPFELQQQFASKIEAIEKQKELIKKSIKETEDLFNSRMDYYFN